MCDQVPATLSIEIAAPTLARIAAGDPERWVLPWLPVLQGAADARNIAEWKRLAATEPDSKSRSDFGALALVFAELAGTAPLWHNALKEWNMIESPQVLAWQRDARLETSKEYVQRAIQQRFGTPLPAGLADRLTALKSKAEIDHWFDASLTAPSLDVFRSSIQNGKRKRKRSSRARAERSSFVPARVPGDNPEVGIHCPQPSTRPSNPRMSDLWIPLL